MKLETVVKELNSSADEVVQSLLSGELELSNRSVQSMKDRLVAEEADRAIGEIEHEYDKYSEYLAHLREQFGEAHAYIQHLEAKLDEFRALKEGK